MSNQLTSLTNVLSQLNTQDEAQPLVFVTDEGAIGGGYHVTELKQAKMTSIDCGGNVADWGETIIQLLDGQSGTHMHVGKFVGIANQSMKRLSALGDAKLYFEFTHKNKGLRRYRANALRANGDGVTIFLEEERALCKPAAALAVTSQTSGCCGNDAGARCCA